MARVREAVVEAMALLLLLAAVCTAARGALAGALLLPQPSRAAGKVGRGGPNWVRGVLWSTAGKHEVKCGGVAAPRLRHGKHLRKYCTSPGG